MSIDIGSPYVWWRQSPPTIYSTNTSDVWTWKQTVHVDDEQLRAIVREEIAKLPLHYDVPNTPPES